jgi:hypothetical protein
MTRISIQRQTQKLMTRMALSAFMIATTIVTPLATFSATPATPAANVKQGADGKPESAAKTTGGNALRIGMKELGDPQGYRLKTVRTQRDYPFTRPQGWQVSPSSSIHLSFQHGSNLLPERSSLNVRINNRILKSVPLGKDNVTPTTLTIPVPPDLLKDNNILSFQVDQHYTYKCEDPFSEELWTEVLPDSALTLNYGWKPVHPDLALYPFPLLDPLNNYTPTVVGYIIPTGASDQSLEAFGVAAAHLGQQAGWRTLKPYLGDSSSLHSSDNLVLVGTPGENPAIGEVGSALDLPLSGGQFRDKEGTPVPSDAGVLQLIPNPYNPTRAILIISGNSPDGVKKAAHVLAQGSLNKILTGRSAIIKDYQKGADYPYRAWDGFILKSGDNFADLDLPTQTSRGITALPIFYKLKVMPDLFLPGRTKVKLHTRYSYASQLDASQSKLEVLLNGKAIKSVPLDDPAGKSLADMTVDIPSEEFHTFNDLEYRFHLYPEKYDMCRFVTDVHIWGTIHNTSYVDLPGEIKAPLPDVGLINDGGYPFTAYQDMSKIAMVLPDSASQTDLDAMLQLLTRLGRTSLSHKGIELTAYHAGTLPDEVKKDRNLIVIGQRDKNKLFGEMKDKTSLLTENTWNTLQEDQKAKVAQINYSPGQGIVEELISPWNGSRVVLLVTGQNDTALVRDSQLFQNDLWFTGIKQGNVTVINDNGPQSLVLLKKGEARFSYAQDQRSGFQMPTWGWIVVSFFALLGVVSVLRFMFGR